MAFAVSAAAETGLRRPLIDAWKLVPPPQPELADRKTGLPRQHLFCHRGQLVGNAYLNETIIPALCQKASVPAGDSRGALTSHRAQRPRPPHPRRSAAMARPQAPGQHPLLRQDPPADPDRRLARRPTTSPATSAPSKSSSTATASSPEPPPTANSRGSTTTSATASAATTSSPNAPTAWPAPAAPSTSPKSPPRASSSPSRKESTPCSNSSTSPTTSARHSKATATPSRPSPSTWPTSPPPPPYAQRARDQQRLRPPHLAHGHRTATCR